MKISKEIKVSIAAICAIILLFYGINFLKGKAVLKPKNSYIVVFDNVTGLTADNVVFANGYSVGTVGDIKIDYDRPDRIYVRIDVDRNVRIPRGTRAEIETSMMGTTTMRLLLGGENEFLSAGDSLTGGLYHGALDQAGEMVPEIEAMLPKLDSILAALNTLLNDPAIGRTLANAEVVTKNLETATVSLNGLLEDDIPTLTKKLTAVGENVETLTGKISEIDYAATIEKTNETLDNTNRLIADLDSKMNSEEGTLGLMLNDRELYDNLTHMVESGDSLLEDLKAHPKRYVHFSLFGKKDK